MQNREKIKAYVYFMPHQPPFATRFIKNNYFKWRRYQVSGVGKLDFMPRLIAYLHVDVLVNYQIQATSVMNKVHLERGHKYLMN